MKLNRHFLLLLLVAVTVISCSPKYTYETVEGDPLATRIYTLDNGLKVFMTVNTETPRIQTYIAVKVGGKNDPSQTTGLAHYFEHLMFKGTAQFGTQNYEAEKVLLDQIEAQFEIYRTTTDESVRKAIYHVIDSLSYEASRYAIPNEYDKLMASIGAQGTNAYTGFDQTVYVEDIPSNQIENWAKIQADRFENNVIRGFHTELETVYEEKNMSLTKDSRKVYENMMSALYPNHPYGTQTILGTQEHLKNPSITCIKEYHRMWYVPNNMAICLSGDFNPDQMIATIDKYFGHMTPNENLPKTDFQPESPITAPVVREVMGLDAANVSLGWRFKGAASDDADRLNILSSILCNGQAGLLDLDLNQQQKVLSSYAFPNMMADYSMLFMQASPKQGQTLEQVRDLMLTEVAKLKSGDFDSTLILATVNNLKMQIMNYLDTNDGRADSYVYAFINDINWADEVQQMERLGKITKQDIVDFANENLNDNNYAVIYKREGKDPNEQKISKPSITPIMTNRDTSSLFLRDVMATQVQPIEPYFLDYSKDLSQLSAQANIPVLYKQNVTNDIFHLDYVFETGRNNDPAAGIAFDYLEYLGTKKMTPEQLKSEFYKIACSFSVNAGTERSYITLTGLGENMGRAMELLEDLLAEPQPNVEALENMKDDIIKERLNAKLNQDANFRALQSYARYGAKSPQTNVLSSVQLESLRPEQLLGCIKTLKDMEHRIFYYGPKSESELLADLKAYHRVPGKLNPTPELVKFEYIVTDKSKVMLAQYDAKQIYFNQMSNRGDKYDPTNDANITMYNEYFGGGMNGIVFQEMREARGLAYSAYASVNEPLRVYNPYTFNAFIATQNDKMGDAMAAFADIINNMPESETAFALAKDALIARMRTQRVVKSDVLWNYVSAQDMGIDYDRNRKIYEQVQNMTLADVKAFQQQWIKDRSYTYCVLGDDKDLDIKTLEGYGPITKLTQQQIFGY